MTTLRKDLSGSYHIKAFFINRLSPSHC